MFAASPRRRTRGGEDVRAKIVHVIACDPHSRSGFFDVFVFVNGERINPVKSLPFRRTCVQLR